ncbi:DUF6185 family protein [Streptomyces rubiginosohelvolus]|uniref:DUF6185 family protein n=1 Tax=Streptomyces rubiginosohelvolus TaxID=67362 RepID=UPI0033A3C1CA
MVSTTALVWIWLSGTGAAADDECSAAQLKAARVSASVRLKHAGEDFTKAESRFTVRVPKSWDLADGLLLNGDTERYRTAMRCLQRSPDAPYQHREWEGRTRAPKVTVQEKWITVDHTTMTWISDMSERVFGPWRITVGNRLWSLRLVRPPALDHAWWEEITVDLGGRAARSVSSPPTTGNATELTWSRSKAGGDPPETSVLLQPPAAKASAARWSTWGVVHPSLASLLYYAVILAMLLAAVRALKRSPVSVQGDVAEERTVRNLRIVGWLVFAITTLQILDDALLSHFSEQGTALFWTDEQRTAVHFVLALLTGLVLCFVGKPGRTAVAVVFAASAYVITVAIAPEWFALPSNWFLESETWETWTFQEEGGMCAFVGACACVVFIWLVGLTSSLIRWWRSSSALAPGSSRGTLPSAVLGVFAVLALALPAVSVWTAQNLWEHKSWLSQRHPDETAYDFWSAAGLFNEVRWFPSDWLDWINGGTFWWWAPSMALIAVLRARDAASAGSAVVPEAPERRTLQVLFVFGVSSVVGWYAGIPLAVPPLLALWLALTGLLAYGTRRAVLFRELAPGIRLHHLCGEPNRQRLLKSARRHRELHAQLRRLEQGHEEGQRGGLERELDRLNRLPHPSPPPGLPNTWIKLPPSVGPVDLALAWGPRATWWGNGCRGAWFAALLGIPASGVLLWAGQIRGLLWADKFMQRLGFADVLLGVINLQLFWALAGFTLGALWRLLPGRRGPARALGLSLVYAVPLLVHWIGTRLFEQPFGTWGLDVSLTLMVLTLTGVAMDIDTFRQREGHYWPTNAGLLLSVYQWRTASVQAAFLVGQIVALVTIWQQLKGADPMVLITRNPTNGDPVGGDLTGSP